MDCRDEILRVVRQIIKSKGKNEFTIIEVIRHMNNNGTGYAESTIRTHICSKMCVNAPDNHDITFNDLERIRKGVYKLL